MATPPQTEVTRLLLDWSNGEAEPLLSEGFATLKAKRGDNDPRTQQALARLNNAKPQGRKEPIGPLRPCALASLR